MKKKKVSGVYRTPSLITERTGKVAFTYIGGTICAALVSAVDSLVAGVSIGPDALAAIAAAGPLLAVDQILHCLLGYGIDKLMINAIGKEKRKEADRIFGAVLIAVFIIYLLVYIPILIFERPLLQLFIEDQDIIEMAVQYSVPLIVASPFIEVCLCIERAFRIDGRVLFFSLRNIITNIGNIIYDVLFVSVMGFNLTGLAYASIISALIGYAVSLTHFFSRKRTVRPDLSVILCPKELLSYLKDDIIIGSSATVDEVMDGLALSTQTAAISAVSGPGGLAVWTVFKSLRGLFLALNNGIAQSVSVHTDLLNSTRDYDGARYSVRTGIRISQDISLITVMVIMAFAGPIASLYNIQPELCSLCAQCLRIGCIAFPAVAYLTVITAYLPAVGRNRLSNVIVLTHKGLTILFAGICYFVGLRMIIAACVCAVWAAEIVVILFLRADRGWFIPKRNPDIINDYSIRLKKEQISEMSQDVSKRLRSFHYPEPLCSRVALVVEDSMNYIAEQNPDRKIRADIQMTKHEEGIMIVIVDDSRSYNPINSLKKPDKTELGKPGELEAVIVLGLTAAVKYDRVLDLNHLSLFVNHPAQAEAG